MNDYISLALVSIGAGAMVSILGLAIVLGYRGSGFVNFAMGAVATYIAYFFNALRMTGDLVPPVGRIHLADAVSTVPAMAIALLFAGLLGVLMHFLVFRPLRSAPPLAKVVSTIGMTLILQATVVLRFGSGAQRVPTVLPDESHTVRIFGDLIPLNRILLAVFALVVAAVLTAIFRYTRFGLAIRASAESEKGATLLGYSPLRQGAVTWVLACMLAGMGGILLAPIVPLDPESFTLLIVPALAAALIGRFSAFGPTVVAGILIGMAQGVAVQASQDLSWFPPGTDVALPLIVLIVVLFLRGRSIPERGTVFEGRLPAAPVTRHVTRTTVVAFMVGLGFLFVLSAGYRLAYINSLTFAIICLSLVIVVGFIGQISLAQLTLAGCGAFMLSRLSTDWGIPFPLAPLLAAVFVSLVGALVALPALRIRGTQLAVVTLAAATAISSVYFGNSDLSGASQLASALVPSPSIFGLDLGITGAGFPRVEYGILVLVVLTVVAMGVANLRRSTLGRQMLAVRSDEAAAAAAGVNVAGVKIIAFALSAFVAGIGGGLIGYSTGNVSPVSFVPFLSLSLLAFAYLGGVTSVSGAMIGGAMAVGGFMSFMMEDLLGIGKYTVLVGGIGVVITCVAHPDGVSGALRQAGHAIRRRFNRRRARESMRSTSTDVGVEA